MEEALLNVSNAESMVVDRLSVPLPRRNSSGIASTDDIPIVRESPASRHFTHIIGHARSSFTSFLSVAGTLTEGLGKSLSHPGQCWGDQETETRRRHKATATRQLEFMTCRGFPNPQPVIYCHLLHTYKAMAAPNYGLASTQFFHIMFSLWSHVSLSLRFC